MPTLILIPAGSSQIQFNQRSIEMQYTKGFRIRVKSVNIDPYSQKQKQIYNQYLQVGEGFLSFFLKPIRNLYFQAGEGLPSER